VHALLPSRPVTDIKQLKVKGGARGQAKLKFKHGAWYKVHNITTRRTYNLFKKINFKVRNSVNLRNCDTKFIATEEHRLVPHRTDHFTRAYHCSSPRDTFCRSACGLRCYYTLSHGISTTLGLRCHCLQTDRRTTNRMANTALTMAFQLNAYVLLLFT